MKFCQNTSIHLNDKKKTDIRQKVLNTRQKNYVDKYSCLFSSFVCIQFEDVGPETTGSGKFPLDFRKRDSETGSGLRFRLISGKFRYPDLINVSVRRFPSGSGVS